MDFCMKELPFVTPVVFGGAWITKLVYEVSFKEAFFFFQFKRLLYYLVLRNENVFFLRSLLFLTAKTFIIVVRVAFHLHIILQTSPVIVDLENILKRQRIYCS